MHTSGKRKRDDTKEKQPMGFSLTTIDLVGMNEYVCELLYKCTKLVAKNRMCGETKLFVFQPFIAIILEIAYISNGFNRNLHMCVIRWIRVEFMILTNKYLMFI